MRAMVVTAFIGEDYPASLQHVTSQPVPIE